MATAPELKRTKISSATECKLKILQLGFWFSKDSLSKRKTQDFMGPYI